MNVIYVVLPLALLLSAVAVGAFLWATRRGQFDDMQTPALRMLHEDAAELGNVRDSKPNVTTPRQSQ